MPPRRQQTPALNPIAIAAQLVALLFARGPGGAKKATAASFGVVALCVVMTFGWYLFQSSERKQEIRQVVSNSQKQHKHIKVTEVLWDIWTLYFHRPFVHTNVHPGESIAFAGEPERTTFPHEIRTLHNQAYTVGYCDALCDPAWVCYRVFDLEKRVYPPKRPESFFMDTRTAARVESAFYTSSGYDRGHMAPNYAIGTRFGAAAQEETFLMSNICPQRHQLNAGLWKELELRIADNYTGRYGQIWVVDGPIFGPEDRLQKLRNKVSVPVAFYMIILQQHEGGVRAESFIIEQQAPSRGSLDAYLTSISDIETKTGLNFFPQMEKAAQAKLEGGKADSTW